MLTLVFSVTFNYAQAKELTKSETIAIIEIFKSLGILTSEQVQIIIAVLNLNLNSYSAEADSTNAEDSQDFAENSIKKRSVEVLTSINEKNFENFNTLIHPIKGVRISRNDLINLDSDKKFTPSEISNLVGSNKPIFWGIVGGSARPLEMTFTDYFSRYSDPDYLNAPNISFNKVLKGGTSLLDDKQIKEAYKNSFFISYHYPHKSTFINDNGEEVIQQNSWVTLNLVFEEYNGMYYLIAIIEDYWTI